jgi:C4-dicarboxylate-specific signal transduction histidine kinase
VTDLSLWSDSRENTKTPVRKLYIDVDNELDDEGPAIVIADTGPGFQDVPERLIRPFFTRKPDGMGLGLYYSNIAMELSDGKLLFPERDELHLPKAFDGAAVALVFKEAR